MATQKPLTGFANFEALDIRIGQVVKAEEAATKKPTYRLTVDFGPEMGHKVSCGAYRNYTREALLGKHVICVINLGTKKMGPEISEVLVLGVANAKGETIYLTSESPVTLGSIIF